MNYYYIELIETKQGKNGWYNRLSLNDGTGRCLCYIWQADPDNPPTARGKVLKTTGLKEYNGFLSVTFPESEFIEIAKVPKDHPVHSLKIQGEYNGERLLKILGQVVDRLEISKFWRLFLSSDRVVNAVKAMEKYPAGKKVHHPYLYGLTTHVAEAVMTYRNLSFLPFHKDRLCHEVAIVSLLFHDYGKIKEYDVDTFEITEEMYYHGHVYISTITAKTLLEDFYREYDTKYHDGKDELFHKKLAHIEHCILSHHGQKDCGSPVAPATLEASLVHICDLISAKQNAIDISGNMEYSVCVNTNVLKNV